MSKNTGTISDKLAVAAARVAGTPVEEAVIKATRTDMLPPKEKHVRALVVATNDGATMPGDITDALLRRLESWDWNVVLKTLMLAHRLIREGSQRFVNDLKYRPSVFPVTSFSDNASALGIKNSPFVRKYATFLEEKVNCYKALKIEIDKHPHALKDLGVDDIFAKVPKLQSLFNALLNCRIAKADLHNSLIISAFTYLLKDSFVLYQALNEAVINLLERFFSMQLEDAKKALEIYKLFCKETNSLISLYDQCKSFTSSVPDLSKAPEDLLTSMEEYVSGLETKGAGGGGDASDSDGDGDDDDDSESVTPDPEPIVVKKESKSSKSKKNDGKKKGKADKDKKKSKKAAAGDTGSSSKKERKQTAAAAPTQTNLLDFDDFDFAGGSSGGTGAPAPAAAAAPFNPFDSPAAAASSTSSPAPATDLFDPFGNTASPSTTGPDLSVDDKLARIQLVQQMSSSSGGAAMPVSGPALTPAPGNPFANSAPAPANFNPFPQQPMRNSQPAATDDAWSNPFA